MNLNRQVMSQLAELARQRQLDVEAIAISFCERQGIPMEFGILPRSMAGAIQRGGSGPAGFAEAVLEAAKRQGLI